MADDVKDKLVTLEDLKAVTDTINDETTGINLIRGSRDFLEGSIIGENVKTYYKDGFCITTNIRKLLNYNKDELGFTVLNISNHDQVTVNTANMASSAEGLHLSKGDVFTFVVDFMVDDVLEWDDRTNFCCARILQTFPTLNSDQQQTMTLPSDLESGKWYTLIQTLTVEKDYSENYGFPNIAFQLRKNGSINFKKPCIYKGAINNPVWSPSPFDVAQEVNLKKVEDEYTDINKKLNGLQSMGYKSGSDTSYYTFAKFPASSTDVEMDFLVTNVVDVGNRGRPIWVVTANNRNATDSINLKVYQLTDFYNPADVKSPVSNSTRWWWYLDEGFVYVGCTCNRYSPRVTITSLSDNSAWSNNYDFGILSALYQTAPSENLNYVEPIKILNTSDGFYNLGEILANHQIPENADLNTYIVPGTYSCIVNTIVPTLSNCPFSNSAFKLYVEDPAGSTNSNYRKQRAIVYSESSTEWIRYSTNKGSTWSDWRQTYANTTVRPIEGGGTGGTTAREAQYNLLHDMEEPTGNVIDSSMFVMDRTDNASKTNGQVAKRPATKVWDWIAAKIRSVFGFTEDNKLPVDKVENLPTMHYCIMKYTLKGATSGQILLNLINPSSTYITSMEKLDGEDLDGSLYLNNLIMHAKLVSINDSGSGTMQYDSRYGTCSMSYASSRKIDVKNNNINLFYEPQSSTTSILTYAIILNIQWYK